MHSTAWHENRRGIQSKLRSPDYACAPSGLRAAAALRRHARHRQSSPLTGIGNRAVSSAHQQVPERSQPNSVPQREQARRRGSCTGISCGFVMICAKAGPSFSCRVHLRLRYIRPRARTRKAVSNARRTHRWPAIRKPPWLRSTVSASAPAAARPATSSTRPRIRAGSSRRNCAAPMAYCWRRQGCNPRRSSDRPCSPIRTRSSRRARPPPKPARRLRRRPIRSLDCVAISR
ncbi:hypothetical protein ACVWW4_006396 [Bradyrhizobium sp. LB7.1]